MGLSYNKRLSRPQRIIKQNANDTQVREMQEAGDCTSFEAPNHSQVHLTPRLDGSDRFCIDYGQLNAVTERQTWPIPNIKEWCNELGTAAVLWGP